MTTPDIVVVGHVVQDLTPQGSRLGGAATFASVQARRLGRSVGVATRARQDILQDPQFSGIEFAGRSSETTTTFENVYDGASRWQRVPNQADGITVADVPVDWQQASTVLLGPVCGEVAHDISRVFTEALIGVGAQGWLRSLDEDAHVQRTAWRGEPFWRGCRVLFVSDEDLVDDEQLALWVTDLPTVVVTRERRGARVHDEGRWREIHALPVEEVDATGAGDVFAAAFLIRLEETNDVADAARFASVAAAFAVEAEGIEAIATREQIDERLSQHPELMLR